MARDKKHTRILQAIQDHRQAAGRTYLIAKNRLIEVITSKGDRFDRLDVKIAARNLLEAIDYLESSEDAETVAESTK